MNERIIELADKAIEDIPGAWNIPDEFCKKFAESLIRECVGLVNDQLQHNNPNDSLLALKIKEHFGVSE